ncbi:MAG TPA: TIGR00730 family Rossman fold protein [Xanthobacteraceae bacterium]|nr:TIGR00730 family Rossman fold protein [Xanthobacteraceae bacterium]
MNTIKKICVYCGSGSGSDPIFVEAARKLGKAMAEHRIGLVYGGGSVGLMGEVSNAVLDHGGEITGIIPTFLMTRERASRRGEIVITRDMHERKQQMFERADAFVALPGGIGTLEEVIEQMTWKQLGQHRKPILLANIKGFWDPLCALFDHMNKLAFIRPGLDITYLVADRAEDILPTLLKAARGIPEADKTMKTATTEMM